MIRIMLVDDEPFIRVAIRSLFSWEQYDYFIVSEASNGTDALMKLEKEDIDLLITDIKMPVMDGIELLQQVKIRFPHIRCVVLSNYEDFDLTRKAFLAGAVDYLLKGSLNEENFSALVHRLNNNYFNTQTLSSASHTAPLRPSFERKVSALQQAISENLSVDALNAVKLELDIGFPYIVSSVKLFSPGSDFNVSEPDSHTNEVLIKNTVFKIISEISEFKLYYYAVSTKEYVFFIYHQKQDDELFFHHLKAFYDQLTSNLFIYLNKFSVIGTSQIYHEISEIPKAYREAVIMSDRIFYCKESTQYFFTPLPADWHTENPVKKFVLSNIESISLWIKVQTWDSLRAFLDELLQTFEDNLYPPAYSKRIITNLEFLIINELSLEFSDNKGYFSDYDHLFDETMQTTHITALRTITSDFLSKITDAFSNLYLLDSNCSDIVLQAVTFLQKHYQDPDLTLTLLAKEIGVNPSYLSRLFHKVTKKTFNTYLNYLRLEHAKELLCTTSDNIVTIAEKSGYNNSKYFINLFKKIEGQSPSAYRTAQTDALHGKVSK